MAAAMPAQAGRQRKVSTMDACRRAAFPAKLVRARLASGRKPDRILTCLTFISSPLIKSQNPIKYCCRQAGTGIALCPRPVTRTVLLLTHNVNSLPGGGNTADARPPAFPSCTGRFPWTPAFKALPLCPSEPFVVNAFPAFPSCYSWTSGFEAHPLCPSEPSVVNAFPAFPSCTWRFPWSPAFEALPLCLSVPSVVNALPGFSFVYLVLFVDICF